jgi:hypothetical protein
MGAATTSASLVLLMHIARIHHRPNAKLSRPGDALNRRRSLQRKLDEKSLSYREFPLANVWERERDSNLVGPREPCTASNLICSRMDIWSVSLRLYLSDCEQKRPGDLHFAHATAIYFAPRVSVNCSSCIAVECVVVYLHLAQLLAG